MSRTLTSAVTVLILAGACPAAAKCSDEIKALQGKAAQTDAANNPGEQKQTGDPQTKAPSAGGGTKSASEKILEAQAYDQKGDEENCMKAVAAAKAATDQN